MLEGPVLHRNYDYTPFQVYGGPGSVTSPLPAGTAAYRVRRETAASEPVVPLHRTQEGLWHCILVKCGCLMTLMSLKIQDLNIEFKMYSTLNPVCYNVCNNVCNNMACLGAQRSWAPRQDYLNRAAWHSWILQEVHQHSHVSLLTSNLQRIPN